MNLVGDAAEALRALGREGRPDVIVDSNGPALGPDGVLVVCGSSQIRVFD